MQSQGSNALILRTVRSESTRIFVIKFLPFVNGRFIAISEGSDRIGSICVSIKSYNKVNTAKVIPSKSDSMFISTLSERISSMINGISVISLDSSKQLNLDDMRAIIEELMNLIKMEGNESDNQNERK
jgi:hypothetical protein